MDTTQLKVGDKVWVCQSPYIEGLVEPSEVELTWIGPQSEVEYSVPGTDSVWVSKNRIYANENEAWDAYATEIVKGYEANLERLQESTERFKEAKVRLGTLAEEDCDVHSFMDELGHRDTKEMGDPKYARWWFHNFLLPAYLRMQFERFMKPFNLFCTYEGKVMKVVGASRMGDVWITSKLEGRTGYEKRVDMRKCSYWSQIPRTAPNPNEVVCRVCQREMFLGVAIPPAMVWMSEGTVTQGNWDGVAPIVKVWKCGTCGHSFTVKEPETALCLDDRQKYGQEEI